MKHLLLVLVCLGVATAHAQNVRPPQPAPTPSAKKVLPPQPTTVPPSQPTSMPKPEAVPAQNDMTPPLSTENEAVMSGPTDEKHKDLQFGVFAGGSFTTVKTDTGGVEEKGLPNYRAGVVGVTSMNDRIAIRYGFGYATRHFEFEAGGATAAEFQFNWVDIPVSIQYNLSERFSLYAGPTLAVNVDNTYDASGVETEEESLKNMYAMLHFGGIYNIHQKHSVELYIEHGFNGMVRRAPPTIYSSIGVNYVYWFSTTYAK